MSSFIAAYLLIWVGLLSYVVRLGTHQRRLARSLESLQHEVERRAATGSAGPHATYSGKGVLA